MRNLGLLLVLALSGCAAPAGTVLGTVAGVLGSTLQVVGSAVQTGQEVCAIGQTIVALQNADGTPVTVTGKTATDVANACKAVSGIVVSPPPTGTTVPTITVAGPSAAVTVGPTGGSVTVAPTSVPVSTPASK